MEYTLLFLKAPTNIEKKVWELKISLYREGDLFSALGLPIMIPLCFVPLHGVPTKRAEMRDALRRGVGRETPELRSGAIVESDGFLFWGLDPRKGLQRLSRSSRRVFSRTDTQPPDQKPAPRPDLFPVARGFFLCSLQGLSRSVLPAIRVPEPLSFPAKAAVLLRFHQLSAELGKVEQSASDTEVGAWWQSLFWEKLEEIPLRKPRAAG